MVEDVVKEELIFSVEDFKKYFNCDRIVTVEDMNKAILDKRKCSRNVAERDKNT